MNHGVSPSLIAAAIAFVAAQVIKYFLNLSAKDSSGWRQLYMSGRMPSGHTATMTALTTALGLEYGLDSGVFSIAVVMTLLIAYDAIMSRRSVGEQGLALRKLLLKSPYSKDPLPHLALGHTPLEMLAGILLGIVVGFLTIFFTTQ